VREQPPARSGTDVTGADLELPVGDVPATSDLDALVDDGR